MDHDWIPSVLSSSRGNSPQDHRGGPAPHQTQRAYPSLHDSGRWAAGPSVAPSSPLAFSSPLRTAATRGEMAGGVEPLGNDFLSSSLCETPLPVMAPAAFASNVGDSGGAARGESRRGSGGADRRQHVAFHNDVRDGTRGRRSPQPSDVVSPRGGGHLRAPRVDNLAFGGGAGARYSPGSSATCKEMCAADADSGSVGAGLAQPRGRGTTFSRQPNGSKALLADSAWIKRKSMQDAADAAAVLARRRPETAPPGHGNTPQGSLGLGGGGQLRKMAAAAGAVELEPPASALFGGGEVGTHWGDAGGDGSLLFVDAPSDDPAKPAEASRRFLPGNGRRPVSASCSGLGGKEFLTPFSAAAGRRGSALRADDAQRSSPPKQQYAQQSPPKQYLKPSAATAARKSSSGSCGSISWVAVSGFKVGQWPKVKAALEPVTGPIDSWALTDGEIHAVGFRNVSAAQKCVVLSGCRASGIALLAAWPASILFDPPQHSVVAIHGKQPVRSGFTGRPDYAAQASQAISRHSHGEFGAPYDYSKHSHKTLTFTGHSAIPSVAVSFMNSLMSLKNVFSPFLMR